MVTLAVEGSGGSELTYSIDKPSLSLGASGQNDVVIREAGVAPHHLIIQRNGNVFTFIGQNRQVVVMNGERRSRGVLKVGDRLRIGTATLILKSTEAGPEGDKADAAPDPAEASVAEPGPKSLLVTESGRARSEVVLYSEPGRLALARGLLIAMCRPGADVDLAAKLRGFFTEVFANRGAMLAWVDQEGSLQPMISSWEGEPPRLPGRTFAELAAGGRYAELRLGARQLIIFPVLGQQDELKVYLVVETHQETQEDDGHILALASSLIAVSWERVVGSSSFFDSWEKTARAQVERMLVGSSELMAVLRDAVLQAARSHQPVLVCGKAESGRLTVARLITSLHPFCRDSVKVIQASQGDDVVLRQVLDESDGTSSNLLAAGVTSRGGTMVIRDVHLLPPQLQHELAEAIVRDCRRGIGPQYRWIATAAAHTPELVTGGEFDDMLFNLFRHHLMLVPSLERRREDLPLLVVDQLNKLSKEQGKTLGGIDLETLTSILSHSFPGEMTELVLELRRLVTACLEGEVVTGIVPMTAGISVLPEGGDNLREAAMTLLASDDLKAVIPAVERLIIDRVLIRTRGNQSKAARILKLSRGALIAKMKDYDIADYRHLRRK